MGGGRSPKRQRKKDAAAARREAMAGELARRRRNRRYALLAGLTVLLVGGAGLAVAFFSGNDSTTPAASPTTSPAGDDSDTDSDKAAGIPDTSKVPAPADNISACEPEDYSPPDQEKPMFSEVQDQNLDADKTYTWRLETTCGRIDVALDVKRAPTTTNSIVFLTRQGFYDGLTFHRVAKDFVIQGGDPKGDGTGGPGYKVEEKPPADISYSRGTVAMAKAGAEPPGTSGSQFFIMSRDTDLPAEYALVGVVTDGIEVVDTLNALGSDASDPSGQKPSEIVHIKSATIIEN